MTKWHNKSGKPLSSLEWLKIHHSAKLPERKLFVQSLIYNINPKRIIDLGCASGLWLDIFNEFLSKDCEFIGIDINKDSIVEAKKLSKKWDRKVSFLNIDIVNDSNLIPEGDLFLAFNLFCYIEDASSFINIINSKINNDGCFVIRQYDGATMRFGPMPYEDRNYIEDSLFNAVGDSKQFKHYDIDRIYNELINSSFDNKQIFFETFEKHSPFSDDFHQYYKGTIEWTINYINDTESKTLQQWYSNYHNQLGYYFLENYLVSVLSCESPANSQRS